MIHSKQKMLEEGFTDMRGQLWNERQRIRVDVVRARQVSLAHDPYRRVVAAGRKGIERRRLLTLGDRIMIKGDSIFTFQRGLMVDYAEREYIPAVDTPVSSLKGLLETTAGGVVSAGSAEVTKSHLLFL